MSILPVTNAARFTQCTIPIGVTASIIVANSRLSSVRFVTIVPGKRVTSGYILKLSIPIKNIPESECYSIYLHSRSLLQKTIKDQNIEH